MILNRQGLHIQASELIGWTPNFSPVNTVSLNIEGVGVNIDIKLIISLYEAMRDVYKGDWEKYADSLFKKSDIDSV